MSGGAAGQTEQPIVVIAGPTATGKTAIATELAVQICGEIISADSMSVYRGMDIGTAKPSTEERQKVSFHLIDVANPDEQFNVSRFKVLAEEALAEIQRRKKRTVLAGGTGLYMRVFLEGYGLAGTAPDETLRAQLESDAEMHGVSIMHHRLRLLDPEAATKIHPNDKVRILRALEVCLRTGMTISSQHARDAMVRSSKRARKFALTASRDELYKRINERVDLMIERGLATEVRGLLERGYDTSLTSMRSLGYKEMAMFVRGGCDFDTAIEDIKKGTRRFAKRQLTWFRAEKDLTWIDVGHRSPAEIAAEIRDQLR